MTKISVFVVPQDFLEQLFIETTDMRAEKRKKEVLAIFQFNEDRCDQ